MTWYSGNSSETTHCYICYFLCYRTAFVKTAARCFGRRCLVSWRFSASQTAQAKEVRPKHYNDVIMTTMASQITSLTVVYSTVYSDADQRKHQSSASLAFVRGNHQDRWIPRTKGQLRGKCFHSMTSSWDFAWRLYQVYYIGQPHQSHNAPVPHPIIQHFGTEMCIFLFESDALWDMGQLHSGIYEFGVFGTTALGP